MFNSMLNSFKPNQTNPEQDDDTPWLISTIGKAVGTVAGVGM